MTKYFSARTIRTPRRFLVIARFAFFLGVISLSSLLSQTGEQQLLDKAKAPQKLVHASRSTDAFLQLAETVGQSEPAKRLVEYTLQNGGSASERYWAIVDFNQPSKNRRFYVFDTETKEVDT